MLFNAMVKWLNVVHLGHWSFAVHCAVETLNNTPKPRGFTSKEAFAVTKGDRNFKHYHAFGCPAYVLDPALQAGHKTPNWQPMSKPCVFIGKSRQHVASVSMTLNPATNFISSNFHIVYDDDYQTMSSNANTLPPNWRDVFDIEHCADDEEFTMSLKATMPNNSSKYLKVNMKLDENKTKINGDVNAKVSEGADSTTVLEGATSTTF